MRTCLREQTRAVSRVKAAARGRGRKGSVCATVTRASIPAFGRQQSTGRQRLGRSSRNTTRSNFSLPNREFAVASAGTIENKQHILEVHVTENQGHQHKNDMSDALEQCDDAQSHRSATPECGGNGTCMPENDPVQLRHSKESVLCRRFRIRSHVT